MAAVSLNLIQFVVSAKVELQDLRVAFSQVFRFESQTLIEIVLVPYLLLFDSELLVELVEDFLRVRLLIILFLQHFLIFFVENDHAYSDV